MVILDHVFYVVSIVNVFPMLFIFQKFDIQSLPLAKILFSLVQGALTSPLSLPHPKAPFIYKLKDGRGQRAS
jgi:hypothetical protein